MLCLQLSVPNRSLGWRRWWTGIQFGNAFGRGWYILLCSACIEEFSCGRRIAFIRTNYWYAFYFFYTDMRTYDIYIDLLPKDPMWPILLTRTHHRSICPAAVVHDRPFAYCVMVLRSPKWLCLNCPATLMPYGQWKNVLTVSVISWKAFEFCFIEFITWEKRRYRGSAFDSDVSRWWLRIQCKRFSFD